MFYLKFFVFVLTVCSMARYLYHFTKRVTFVVKDATPKTKFIQYYLEAHPNSMDICTIKHFENLGHQLGYQILGFPDVGTFLH